MTIYIIALIVTTLPIYILENSFSSNKEIKIKYMLIMSFIVLFLLGAFRAESVGSDVLNYKKYYFNGFPGHKMEPLYVLLSNTISSLTGNYQIFLALVQMLVLIPIYLVIKKKHEKALSLFIYQAMYLYVNSYNIFRQAIAMGIVFFAVDQLDKNELSYKSVLTYLFMVLFASMFHAASLFFLIIPMVKYIELDGKKIFIFILMSLFISYYRNPILKNVFSLFDRNYYDQFSIHFGVSTILILSLLLVMIVLDLIKQNISYKKNKLFINLLVFSLLFNLFWAWFPNHARISQYIYLIIILWTPDLISNSDFFYKGYNLRKIGSFLFLFVFYILMLYVKDPGAVVPYVSILS